jgi:HD-GYP domain-containing protein (c-di-GMP phosphodiesterase class II)
MNEYQQLQERIRRLNQIGISLSSEHDLNVLLEMIVKEARGFCNADAGSLYLVEDDGLSFEVAQNDTLDRRLGDAKQPFKAFKIPLTTSSLAGYVAVTGNVLNIEDVYQIGEDEEYNFNRDFDNRNDYRTESMLVTPMKDNDREIIGVIQLINAMDEKGRVVPFGAEVEELVLSLASQAAVAINNTNLINQIKDLFESLVQYSATAIDARSPHTAGHSRRVSLLAAKIAQAISDEKEGPFAAVHFTPEQINEIRIAGWLHDIGKIGVREHVLEKADKLTADRMEAIENRFKTFIKDIEVSALKRLTQAMAVADPDPSEISRIEEDLQEKKGQFSDDLEFIKKVNIPGFLKDEDLARLEGIHDDRYIDSEGREHPFITDFEYKNLSVRKGSLTHDEYMDIQNHVVHTKNILGSISFTKDLANVPLFAAQHHEMLNGKGYPEGLTGDQLPIQSRILAVLDIYEALTASDRPYKKAMPVERAFSILDEFVKDGHLDADVVNLFRDRKLYEGITPPFTEDPEIPPR